jgi:hypothetical protein
MALESRDMNPPRGSSISRMARVLFGATLAVFALGSATAVVGAQAGDKAKVADAVRADLSRLADLERTWYEKNRAFTTDLRALGFTPASGANITMAYASARSWAANATHPQLQPTTCFIVVSQPGTGGSADRPFCSEAAGGQVAAAPAQRPQTTAPAPTAQPAPAQPTTTAPQRPAPQTATPSRPTVVNRRPAQRPAQPVAPAPTTVLEIPARAPSTGAALAATRAAGGVSDAGVTEAVTPAQFTERLSAIVSSALDVSNAKMPDVARDPYESTAEYQARVAQAYATFQRRESEFYARNTRTYLVAIPVKAVKYDPDREVVEFTVDPIALPTARSFAAAEGARLSVACYTRPYFWCSPEAGMSYDGTDMWRVPRATARSVDVLNAPLTLMARFVVGRRDDARSPSVSLISMELQAKGSAIGRWDSAVR